jgi:aspartate-semialdehyde dehydrogenase
MAYKVAVVGATGNVGRQMLSILAERQFPASEVVALASQKSEGKLVSYGEEKTLEVQNLANYDFTGTEIALFSAGSKVSQEYAPFAANSGCIVIDNSSFFRLYPDVPLVVPEVNEEQLANYTKRNIIGNPNCVAMQHVIALAPLHRAWNIKRLVISTYQSVSGAGKESMDELFRQTKEKIFGNNMEPHHFRKPIAFNLIPQIADFAEDGYTTEEQKVIAETQKILGSEIAITVTCVRAPVFIGHSESINIEFEHEVSVEEARGLLQEAEGVKVVDDPTHYQYITPLECVGQDEVFVSRIREDNSRKNCLNIWVVSDNLRKGAALNAVQIAEKLIYGYL